MPRFQHIEHLWALGLIPVVIGLFVLAVVLFRRALRRFGEESLLRQLMEGFSLRRHATKVVLFSLALVFIVLAWANPQRGTRKEKVRRESADVILALDLSTSMLAEDIRPSRLERSRQLLLRLIESLRGERISVIVFAASAELLIPLTTDYRAVETFIRSASPDMLPVQGTAIAEAIRLADRNYDQKDVRQKALILLSDGEDHQAEALEAAREAQSNGLTIFTIGAGTTDGGFVPESTAPNSGYKRDAQGKPVRSKMNEKILRDLAAAGGGSYFNLLQGESIIDAIRSNIELLEKQEFEQRVFSEYESYFQYLIGLGVLLLVIEFFLPYKKKA